MVEVTIGSQSYGEGVLVPFTSLVGSEDTGFHVWRFNDASGKVESVDVSVLHIEKSYALVTGELLKGEKVVAMDRVAEPSGSTEGEDEETETPTEE